MPSDIECSGLTDAGGVTPLAQGKNVAEMEVTLALLQSVQ
jgi:hypothetical protein